MSIGDNIRYDDHQWYQSQSARRNFHHLKRLNNFQKEDHEDFKTYLPLEKLVWLFLTSASSIKSEKGLVRKVLIS